jgi:pentose-5-phosphate-3-epimerase
MYLQRHKIPFVSIVPHGTGGKLVSKTHDHVDAFQSVVKYLVKLRRDGDIDNDTFEGLVRQAAATFVETEISERVDRVLEDKISFERLLELL